MINGKMEQEFLSQAFDNYFRKFTVGSNKIELVHEDMHEQNVTA